MLPVALLGPCVFTVPMATHGSFQRAAAYCEVVVCSGCVEQLNQLQQSILTCTFHSRHSLLVVRCPGRPANGLWHIYFLLDFEYIALLIAIFPVTQKQCIVESYLEQTAFCSLSYIKAQIFPQKKWLFCAFCLSVSSRCCLSSLGLTHSSQDKEQSTTELVLLQKAKNPPWES